MAGFYQPFLFYEIFIFMNVILKKTLKNFKIYIEGLLHVNIPIEEYSGMQSWLEGDNVYTHYIEFYLKNGQRILCEYEDRKLWEEILKQIDEQL